MPTLPSFLQRQPSVFLICPSTHPLSLIKLIEPYKHYRKMRSVLLLLASMFVAVILAETALRVIGLGPRVFKVGPNFDLAGWAEPHPTLGWSNRSGRFLSVEPGHAPMHFLTNGRRASWPVTKHDVQKLVYVIGGSFTQGYGILDRETFAFQLNNLYPRVWFENYGVGGYSTYQCLLKLKALFHSSSDKIPDLVVYGLIKDHIRRSVADPGWIRSLTDSTGHFLVPPYVRAKGDSLTQLPPATIAEWPLETSSALVRLLSDAHLNLTYDVDGDEKNRVIRLLLQDLERFVSDNGSTLLVVLLDKIKGDIKSFLDAEGIRYADCQNDNFYSNPSFRVGGIGHPSALQNTLWARCLKQAIDRDKLLQ